MSEWREVTLGEIADVTVGFVGTMAKHYVDEGIPFLRSLNVAPHRIDLIDLRFVGAGFEARLAKSRLSPGDVVTVRTGKPGVTAVIPESLPLSNCSDLVITRPGPELDANWFSYFMNSSASSQISAGTVGAVQQHFNVASAKRLEMRLPPLAEQRAIVEVLGALDDKIAANTRLAATAESYLRAEVDARWLKRPERDSVLSNYVELNPKLKLKADVAEPIYIDMKRLPESGWTIQGSDNRPAKGGARFANGDTLLARITPCLQNRKTGYVDDLEEGAVGIGSTEFIVMRSVEGIASPISFLLATESRFREFSIQQMIGTSGRQRVAAHALSGFELPTPDKTWLNEFGARAESLFAHVRSLNRENQTFAETRDALLPKLMSGQLRVRDAERIAEAVGA